MPTWWTSIIDLMTTSISKKECSKQIYKADFQTMSTLYPKWPNLHSKPKIQATGEREREREREREDLTNEMRGREEAFGAPERIVEVCSVSLQLRRQSTVHHRGSTGFLYELPHRIPQLPRRRRRRRFNAAATESHLARSRVWLAEFQFESVRVCSLSCSHLPVKVGLNSRAALKS